MQSFSLQFIDNLLNEKKITTIWDWDKGDVKDTTNCDN